MENKPLALITGGTSGIGLAVAKRLSEHYQLALTYASNDERAEIAQAELEGNQVKLKVRVYGGAVYNYEQAQEKIERITRDFGSSPSVLVNCGGTISDGMFLGSDFKTHEKIISEHVMASMSYAHLVLKSMYRQKFGRIINFSSISANFAKRGQVNYATAKGAIESFTKTLALEVAHRGVTVNAIAPGLIETPMTSELISHLSELKGGLKSKIPMARAGQASEVADLVDFLCQKNSYITGQVITIDGGRSLGDPTS